MTKERIETRKKFFSRGNPVSGGVGGGWVDLGPSQRKEVPSPLLWRRGKLGTLRCRTGRWGKGGFGFFWGRGGELYPKGEARMTKERKKSP